jgi:hypothetical protein
VGFYGKHRPEISTKNLEYSMSEFRLYFRNFELLNNKVENYRSFQWSSFCPWYVSLLPPFDRLILTLILRHAFIRYRHLAIACPNLDQPAVRFGM